MILSAIIVFVLQQLIDYIVYESVNITGYIGKIANRASGLLSLTIKDGTLLAGFPYLVLAFYIVKYGKRISSRTAWISFVVILILSKMPYMFWGERFLKNVFLFLEAACLFIGISRIQIPDSKIYIVLRRTSSVVFFSHRIFIFAWKYILTNGAGNYGNVCFLFTLSGTILLSCIINLCYKRNSNNDVIKLLM